MSLTIEWYHSRLLSCFEVRKIHAVFLIKQNTLLLYVIISFENLYLFKLHAWIIYKFCLENEFENVMVGIESYRDIFLYFCEF